MTGRIIFEPKMSTPCDRGKCEGIPIASEYRDGTIWECGHCERQWIVRSETQYNEQWTEWRLYRKPGHRNHTNGSEA